MPYKTNADLPGQLSSLPGEAQTIFRKAFNASFQQYGEESARKIAWSAVKKVFEKKNDKWVKKEKIQAFVRLGIQIKSFSQQEIIARIPGDILEKIKSRDSHPFFQMYSVAHEGISEPEIEGQGHQKIEWLRSAIKSIKKVFKAGVKFFDGHNDTIDIQNKPELGEVIYAFEEEIDGNLNYCVIGYFPPETRERAKEMDICSQEAKWALIKAAGKLIADTCEKFTGIALGNSKYNTPAFKNAKRLAFVQAFNIKNNSPDGESEGGEPSQEKKMTFSEVKEAVKNLNVLPHQLYSHDEIKNDREFGQLFEEINKLTEANKQKDLEIEKFQKTNKELNRNIELQSATGILKKIYKEANLTENMEKFIDDVYEDSKGLIDDLSEDGLKKFVDKNTKIFQKVTGITNAEKKDTNIPTGDEKANDDNQEEKKNPFVDNVDQDYI